MSAQPSTAPASLPISVTPVADQALLCVKVGPLLTYVTMVEAILMRQQLDTQIAALSEGFV